MPDKLEQHVRQVPLHHLVISGRGSVVSGRASKLLQLRVLIPASKRPSPFQRDCSE